MKCGEFLITTSSNYGKLGRLIQPSDNCRLVTRRSFLHTARIHPFQYLGRLCSTPASCPMKRRIPSAVVISTYCRGQECMDILPPLAHASSSRGALLISGEKQCLPLPYTTQLFVNFSRSPVCSVGLYSCCHDENDLEEFRMRHCNNIQINEACLLTQ
jgi:hypothetical protein